MYQVEIESSSRNLVGCTVWVKKTFYKTIGKSKLGWKELEQLLTDIETRLNNKPLINIEQGIQFLVLSPIIMVLGETPVVPNEDPTDI